LEYIAKDDPQCANFKKEIEDRIQSQRQAIVEYARNELLKRNELIKDAKAKRKAEHDEIVRTMMGWVSALQESVKNQLAEEA
jgi:hypothetical protein